MSIESDELHIIETEIIEGSQSFARYKNDHEYHYYHFDKNEGY